MQRTFVRDGVIYQDNGDGTATVVGYENQGTPLGPVDPSAQYEAPKAQADAQRAAAEAALAQAQTPYAAQVAQAEAARAQAEAEKARAEANRDPNAQVLDRGKIGQFLALEQQIARLQDLYERGPGATSGVAGIMDYVPSDANSAFDSAGAGLSEVGLAAFRVPGVGSQSDAELRQFIMANTPRASDRDAAIREKLRNLQTRLSATKQAWGVDPQAPASELLQRFDAQERPNALDVVRTDGAPAPQMAASNNGMTSEAYPEEMVTAHDAMVSRLARDGQGRIDPQAYAAERERLFSQFGYNPGPREANEQWATGVNEYLNSGGRTIPSGILPNERVMSRTETLQNNLVNNPIGAGVAAAGNMGGFGIPQALAPDQFAALSDAQPVGSLVGDIGGAIGGTALVGAAGRNTLGRALPSLLANAPRQQVARNVAADATYGGIYGGVTEGDPLTGAALGAAGSVVGQGIGGAAANVAGGFRRLPEAEALRAQGIRITPMRQIGQGRIEDAMASIPFAGDAVRARQLEGFQDFNRAGNQQVGAPINYGGQDIGESGADQLLRAAGAARSNVMQGRTIPIDAPFLNQASNAIDPNIPANMRGPVEQVLGTRLNRVIQDDALTGDNYAITMSNLKANRANPSQRFTDFEPEFKGSVTNAMDSVTDLIRRSGNDDVIRDLGTANTAYRDAKIIRDAVSRAKGGTASGEVDVYTPAQLKAAAETARNRGFGRSDLMDFANQGQAVLPSTLPNSGTADRALLATGLLGAGSAAVGGATGYNEQAPLESTGGGALTGLLGAAATGLALRKGGSRQAQDALEQLMFERPDEFRRLAEIARRNGGFFGSAGSALGLNYGM